MMGKRQSLQQVLLGSCTAPCKLMKLEYTLTPTHKNNPTNGLKT